MRLVWVMVGEECGLGLRPGYIDLFYKYKSCWWVGGQTWHLLLSIDQVLSLYSTCQVRKPIYINILVVSVRLFEVRRPEIPQYFYRAKAQVVADVEADLRSVTDASQCLPALWLLPAVQMFPPGGTCSHLSWLSRTPGSTIRLHCTCFYWSEGSCWTHSLRSPLFYFSPS